MTNTRISAILLILRAILSVAFLYYGLQKLLGFAPAVEMYDKLGFTQIPRYFTGTAEVLGAIGLWLKGRQLYAAALLVAVMCIATFAQLVFLGPPYFPVPYLLAGALVLVIADRHQFMGSDQPGNS